MTVTELAAAVKIMRQLQKTVYAYAHVPLMVGPDGNKLDLQEVGTSWREVAAAEAKVDRCLAHLDQLSQAVTNEGPGHG